MPDEPLDDATDGDVDHDPDDADWASEIKRLRAARGDRLAEQLADETRKEPPVE
jgi:hypothetical protein